MSNRLPSVIHTACHGTHSYTASYQGKTNRSTPDYSLCYKGLSTTQYSIPTHDHVLDYEVAIRNAAYTVPASTSKAVCPLYSMYLEKRSVHSLSRHQHQRLFVHYTQCFWRNAQRHGLQIAYNKNDDIHLLVRRAAVLPLHPLNTIEDYWFNALEDIDSADTNIATLGFTDYITSYWVEENRHLWNYYATEGPRTTNHLKGWHGNSRT